MIPWSIPHQKFFAIGPFITFSWFFFVFFNIKSWSGAPGLSTFQCLLGLLGSSLSYFPVTQFFVMRDNILTWPHNSLKICHVLVIYTEWYILWKLIKIYPKVNVTCWLWDGWIYLKNSDTFISLFADFDYFQLIWFKWKWNSVLQVIES